jgi:alginate O-acetyltransferase complex protein AlgJ
MTDPEHDTAHSVRRTTDLACVLAFAVVLVVPLAGFLFDWHPVTPPVQPALRQGKPLPAVTPLRTLPERFEGYFDRHLGFREQMVRWNNAITVLWLHTDPATRIRHREGDGARPKAKSGWGRVMLGDDGWLFYLARFSEKSFRGLDPLGSQDLRSWRKHFEERRARLAERNIDYVLALVPEKHSVLPELLPPILKSRVGPSRTDQVLDLLTEETEIDVLDLRQWMRELRTEYPIYHRTGTHWNELGAFLAYRELLLHLQKSYPALEPWPLERFHVQYRWGKDRGLPAMLGIQGTMEDEYVDLTPLTARVARETTSGRRGAWTKRTDGKGHWPGSFLGRSTGREDLPRAVFLHDSFVATYMEPFLSEHFEEVTYYWKVNLPLERMISHTPDIVIELRTERIFDTQVPDARGLLRPRAAD